MLCTCPGAGGQVLEEALSLPPMLLSDMAHYYNITIECSWKPSEHYSIQSSHISGMDLLYLPIPIWADKVRAKDMIYIHLPPTFKPNPQTSFKLQAGSGRAGRQAGRQAGGMGRRAGSMHGPAAQAGPGCLRCSRLAWTSLQGSSGMMDHRLVLILQTASTLISVLRKKNRKRNTHTFRTT